MIQARGRRTAWVDTRARQRGDAMGGAARTRQGEGEPGQVGHGVGPAGRECHVACAASQKTRSRTPRAGARAPGPALARGHPRQRASCRARELHASASKRAGDACDGDDAGAQWDGVAPWPAAHGTLSCAVSNSFGSTCACQQQVTTPRYSYSRTRTTHAPGATSTSLHPFQSKAFSGAHAACH